MLRLLEVLNTMIVTARSIIKATPATKIATVHAEPKIRLKITVGAFCIRLDVDVASDEALIKVVRAGAGVQLELPLRHRALVVCRLRQEDGVDHACDGGIGEGQVPLAQFTVDGRLRVVLVSVGVDAPGLPDRQLRDLLRCRLLLTLGRLRLGNQFDVEEDWMLKSSVVRFPVVVAGRRVGTKAQEGLHADIKSELVLGREEALDALVFVDLLPE